MMMAAGTGLRWVGMNGAPPMESKPARLEAAARGGGDGGGGGGGDPPSRRRRRCWRWIVRMHTEYMYA